MTTPTISEVQEDIIETFNFLGDWTTRYEHIIDLGKQVEDFPDELRVDKNKMEGCQSQVWIVSEMCEGKLFISATSDSAIVRGLIALLLQVYSEREPAEVLTNPPDFVKEINLSEHLSPTRSNGLAAMVSQIMQMAALEQKRIDT
ncbi:uncharacterized protein METZ01_LOCUS243560 [marine metagenome]|uniref:Fe-S metabolism associated domain-containing protein n=1 Tax=marine metagenome TaxID=408172 RepID=A0A382HTL9_9ZZZZ